MWFRVVHSVGPYWQVRVRDAYGNEDTVARVYTLEEAQHTWDALAEEGTPNSDRPS